MPKWKSQSQKCIWKIYKSKTMTHNEWNLLTISMSFEKKSFEKEALSNMKADSTISKNMWFIKRLVEKDKIEREKFWNSETKSSKYSDFELSYDTPREDYKNILLMELAIQDDPITFILKILK